ncbi:hypothetical protein D3C76_1179780 [compost metagenome]
MPVEKLKQASSRESRLFVLIMQIMEMIEVRSPKYWASIKYVLRLIMIRNVVSNKLFLVFSMIFFGWMSARL